MKFNVPIREVKYYQTDDGRKVEVYNKRSEIPTEFDPKAFGEDVKDSPFPKENLIFVGVAQLGFGGNQASGPQEFKFRIPNVNTVEEAFDKFKETAQSTVSELEKRLAQNKQPTLVKASEQDLKNIDEKIKETKLKLVRPE